MPTVLAVAKVMVMMEVAVDRLDAPLALQVGSWEVADKEGGRVQAAEKAMAMRVEVGVLAVEMWVVVVWVVVGTVAADRAAGERVLVAVVQGAGAQGAEAEEVVALAVAAMAV